MTSSSFFDVELRSASGPFYQRRLDVLELPAVEPAPLAMDAATEFAIRFRRTTPSGRLRLSLGLQPIAEIAPDQTSIATSEKAWFFNEFGDTSIRVERQIEDRPSSFEELFELPVQIAPRTEVLADYRVMMEDLQSIHANLAYDLVGRTHHWHGVSATNVLPLNPDSLLQTIERIRDRLTKMLDIIAQQPSRGLVRRAMSVKYRGGERIDAASLQSVIRDPVATIDRRGRVRSLGRVVVRRPSVTLDLPEHRQIAQVVRELAERALLIRRHCRRSIELLEMERLRWGRRHDDESLSVYEQRDLPRIERLEAVAADCSALADSLRSMITRHDFLAEAEAPRSPLGPTPTFLGRPAYRATYEILLEAKGPLGILVDGDALRIAYRDLATLYEYWCFMKVISRLRDRLGLPRSTDCFSLIDDVYRPELSPGQQFRFAAGPDVEILASYTPEFAPLRAARSRGLRFGASLTASPLRPDITIELRQPSRRPVILVLDAKSTEHFSARRFREMSDYSRQIIDWRTGYQPVRQTFLIHRGRQQRALVNLPGYLQGKGVDRQSVVIGAVACAPQNVGFMPPLLAAVIDRFLDLYGV